MFYVMVVLLIDVLGNEAKKEEGGGRVVERRLIGGGPVDLRHSTRRMIEENVTTWPNWREIHRLRNLI